MADLPAISSKQREQHLRWLMELTQIPTAAGREQRVVRWIERWVAERPSLVLTRDAAGNLVARKSTDRAAGEPGSSKDRGGTVGGTRPVFFTAHLDHPAFVVERIVAPSVVELSFRGGVMEEYFKDAAVVLWTGGDELIKARITGAHGQGAVFKNYLAELESPSDALAVGDVGVWDVGPAEVIYGNMHTLACDDLAAAAGALAAFDVLSAGEHNVSLLFTRAEEIGFVGAIAACREGTMPKNARVIALENSRSFADSPIGGGPIVRVGDRISVFSPTLTDAIAKRAEDIAGGPASVTASQKQSDLPAWKWQRKLMAGGACEASVYFNAGYEATCVCLPLGNYHNMADLAAVQAGTNASPPKVGREFISVKDYEGLVDLLVACGLSLPAQAGLGERFEKLWAERKFVLG
jgi:endoglucanase